MTKAEAIVRPGSHVSMRWRWLALALAMVFPSFLSWLDFVALVKQEAGPNPGQTLAYGVGKTIQFAFPLLCVWLFERRLPRPTVPTFRGVELGVAFGVVVAVGMIGLYYGLLRDTPVFVELTGIVRRKMSEFGVDSRVGFWSFAVFLSIFHSLFEEYYWRWFVFGWLRGDAALGRPALLPLTAALIISGFAFMAHHSILLWVYFPSNFWTAVVPFSLCVAGGGIAWAWLYHRTGSIYAAWLSHLLVDAAFFVLGYDMLFVRG